MSSGPPLRVGIIGAGVMGRLHATGWLDQRDGAEIVGVADVDRDAADLLAASVDAQPLVDYRDLLALGGLDAVDICVPPHLHVEIVCAAAAAGIHVLCEKPVATDLAGADQIGDALRGSDVTYMAAHNTLFFPPVERARAILARRELGNVYLLRTWECYTDAPAANWGLRELESPPELVGDSWRASPSQLQGGALIDGGFHAVYRLLHLAVGKPQAVVALMGQFHPGLDWDAEDTAAILVQFDDGAIGEVTISYAFDSPSLGQDTLFTVLGREGLLGGNQQSLFLRHAGWSEPSTARLSTAEGEAAAQASISAEISHFLDCVVSRGAPISGFAEARLALAVVRAAYESAATRQLIQLTSQERVS